MFTAFAESNGEPEVHGFLHEPERASGDALLLTHGAGGNCQSKLLLELAEAFAAASFCVWRFDLPFRLARPQGPPAFGSATKDREGIRRAVTIMRETVKGPVFVGGHSYGGRQASMLVSEEPTLVEGLLLLSYPLHPPRKASALRAAHFPKLRTPAFFVHGTRDRFGTIQEMESALKLIPAPHTLLEVPGAGHDLLSTKSGGELIAQIVSGFQNFLSIRRPSER
jgi:predicted alpha/beta-hydrolase family hydrolase